jgi:hypothetical protein
LPSPSLGPPLLSLSWSPPFPCGIPAPPEGCVLDVVVLVVGVVAVVVVFEVVVVREVAVVDGVDDEEAAAGGAAELALVELELDEPDPQPATISATTTAAAGTEVRNFRCLIGAPNRVVFTNEDAGLRALLPDADPARGDVILAPCTSVSLRRRNSECSAV